MKALVDDEDDNKDITDPDPDLYLPGDDRLTYELSGRDEKSFRINGSEDYNSVVTASLTDSDGDGLLSFKDEVKLNYEVQREYRVTITATDPSGDSAEVKVIVNVTNVNEGPKWAQSKAEVPYPENGTKEVSTYQAVDAELPPLRAGVRYSFVTPADFEVINAVIAADVNIDEDAKGDAKVVATDFVDNDLFEIHSVNGELRFKESPNYEKPKNANDDADPDPSNNVYLVAVKAEVTDNKNPRDFIFRKVMVTVTNVNEEPVFSRTTDTLAITENPTTC